MPLGWQAIALLKFMGFSTKFAGDRYAPRGGQVCTIFVLNHPIPGEMVIRHLPEPELCLRLRNGEERAFREIFDRFHHRIYNFGMHFLKDHAQSEEIVQITFLQFWMYRENLDPQHAIAPLLFTIARRTLIDAWRKAASTQKFRMRIRGLVQPSANVTDEQILAGDLDRMTQAAIGKLNEHQQKVFKLSRLDGLSYDEIAQRMQISRNTVKYHLGNALRTLRSHLGKEGVHYLLFFSALSCLE